MDVQVLRDFYMNKGEELSEDLFVNSNTMGLMKSFQFGSRMINEASEMVEELTKVGELTEAKEIEGDIFIIRVNLNKVRGALNLTMN